MIPKTKTKVFCLVVRYVSCKNNWIEKSYKRCEENSVRTWYSLTQSIFLDHMYSVSSYNFFYCVLYVFYIHLYYIYIYTTSLGGRSSASYGEAAMEWEIRGRWPRKGLSRRSPAGNLVGWRRSEGGFEWKQLPLLLEPSPPSTHLSDAERATVLKTSPPKMLYKLLHQPHHSSSSSSRSSVAELILVVTTVSLYYYHFCHSCLY